MENLTILYLGMHPEIRETVVRVINGNGRWRGIGAGSTEEAMRLFLFEKVDVLLLGCGIDPETEARLRKDMLELAPSLIIIQHYGGGSGLLLAEISMAVEKHHPKTLNPSL
ncbi:Mth938-like domain-containing protein [Parasegetibacter sp. NRK P23]|uniref:Mth938-like domain-containing protein n=1 Tax=Parasegetibacter sp. NRK P23 TaxID=2942999 RepID=UPI00204323DF|nr:Mth938-like domain-containing protein [Parasegetibacter sp. NRK P23]MCM5528335.1 Mth938-like domain-containing protein [Parasegetibacter sp. NRK P23]